MREIQVLEIPQVESAESLVLFCRECGCFCNARASPKLPNRHTGFLTPGQLGIVLSRLAEHIAKHAQPVDVAAYIQDWHVD